MMDKIHYQFGLPEPLCKEAVLLYDEAFGAKFASAVPNHEKRLRLLEDSLAPSFAVVAIVHNELVRHKSLSAFMEFASNKAYLAGIGHRTAALEDSRLLPLVENPLAA